MLRNDPATVAEIALHVMRSDALNTEGIDEVTAPDNEGYVTVFYSDPEAPHPPLVAEVITAMARVQGVSSDCIRYVQAEPVQLH